MKQFEYCTTFRCRRHIAVPLLLVPCRDMSYYSTRPKLHPRIRHRIYSTITSTSIMDSHHTSLSSRLPSVPYTHYRSGTSKGPYFLFSDLPENAKKRDDMIINIMGAGHPQQIRGIGGGTGISSKACIVGRSDPNDTEADIRYMFRQVRVNDRSIDNSHGDCGNMIAAVGSFAIEKGLVQLSAAAAAAALDDGKQCVRVRSENTGVLFQLEVPLVSLDTDKDQQTVNYSGAYKLDSVPGTGSPTLVKSIRPQGAFTGKMLPTGNPIDLIDGIPVSCVDVSRAMVILTATSIGLDMNATREELDNNKDMMARLEILRQKAALIMGMGDVRGKVSPKVMVVSSKNSQEDGAAIVSRYFVATHLSETHPSIAMTAGQCLACACLIPDSIPNKTWKKSNSKLHQNNNKAIVQWEILIAHLSGSHMFTVDLTSNAATAESLLINENSLLRTGYVTTVEPISEGRAFPLT